jgi:hypothetical protein
MEQNKFTKKPISEILNIFLFLLLFLFSNVLTRYSGIDFNIIFYISLLTLIAMAFRRNSITYYGWLYASLLIIYLLYAFMPGYYFVANILSIKDVVAPFLCLQIGLLASRNKTITLRVLNYLFFPFILYGILQEIIFISGNITTLLPWDAEYINFLLENDTVNVYQGFLLRFFGTMNAFVEYQLCAIFIMIFLYLEKEYLANKRIFIVNIILTFAFIIISLERSPIMMSLIAVFVWKRTSLKKLFYKPKVLLSVVGLILVFLISLQYINNNPIFEEAFDRLTKVISLDFSNDEAINTRKEIIWVDALEIATQNPLGVLPGRVVPAANSYPDHIAPHNNFLIYLLGYGIIGITIFIVFMVSLLIRSKILEKNHRHFIQGIFISYFGMSIFNFPFLGKTGILFFFIVGFILNQQDTITSSENG